MPGKKPQQQGYDNTGMVLEDLPDSRGHGPSTGNSSLPLSAQNVHAKNTNSSVCKYCVLFCFLICRVLFILLLEIVSFTAIDCKLFFLL